jgi:hypothetical protein
VVRKWEAGAREASYDGIGKIIGRTETPNKLLEDKDQKHAELSNSV